MVAFKPYQYVCMTEFNTPYIQGKFELYEGKYVNTKSKAWWIADNATSTKVATLTLNPPQEIWAGIQAQYPDWEQLLFIKNYSENEGVFDELIENQLILPSGELTIQFPTHQLEVPICYVDVTSISKKRAEELSYE